MSARRIRIPLQPIQPTTENRRMNSSDKYRVQIVNLHANGHIDNMSRFELWLNNQNHENIEPVLELLKNGFMQFKNGRISMKRNTEMDKLDGGKMCHSYQKISKK